MLRWFALVAMTSAPAAAHTLALELGSSFLPFTGGPTVDAAIEFRISLAKVGSIDLRTRLSPVLARLSAPGVSSIPGTVQTATIRYRTPTFGNDVFGFNVAAGPGLLIIYSVNRGGFVTNDELGFVGEVSPTVDFRLGDVLRFFIAVNGVAGFSKSLGGIVTPLVSVGVAMGFAFDFLPRKPKVSPASARATAPSL